MNPAENEGQIDAFLATYTRRVARKAGGKSTPDAFGSDLMYGERCSKKHIKEMRERFTVSFGKNVLAPDRHMKNAGNASNARGIPCICKETSALIAAAAYFRSVC